MTPRLLTLEEAARALGMPVSGVEALVGAGYLQVEPDAEHLPVSEVKSFKARNAVGGGSTIDDVLADALGADGAEEILDSLEADVPKMASRAADVLASVFPEAAAWTEQERERFEAQAAGRFEAILSVTRTQELVGDDIFEELADAGGAAAFAGAPLPQILLALRISRDLMVQTAVRNAEERGTEWGLALAVVLTRVLPVLDRLTDAVARGYWTAVLTREQEAFARYEHVVEHSANGVYEVDLDGTIRYTNPMMAVLCGRDRHALVGRPVHEVLPPVDTDDAVYHQPTTPGWLSLRATRADGVERELLLQVTERTIEGETVGFDGIVRDVTAEHELERQKDDFVGLLTQELRQPLTTILGLGVTLASYAHELPPERTARMGRSIHHHSERIARLADDLHDISRIRSERLTVSLGSVDVGTTVAGALQMVSDAAGVEVEIDGPLRALADGRRLEQVLAHLVENGLRHGAAPIEVRSGRVGDRVRIEVVDHGPGVPADQVRTLFATLHPSGVDDRLGERRSGLGLPLARALVEAMGGTIAYRQTAGGGACFTVALPVPGAVGIGH